jgi:hypothetical protein
MGNLLWMPQVLLAAKCPVAEQVGWRLRGRAEFGEFKGIMIHHTAGPAKGNAPSLGVVTDGRSDLPGPLCNLLQGRDGTFYAVAAGRANHAGAGSWHGVTSGNSTTIGIECENTGLPADSPWPEVQMQRLAMGVAAMLDYGKLPTIMVMGHREYATPKGRKIDPLFDMNAFRARVDGYRNGAAPRPPVPAKDASGQRTLRRGSEGDDVKTVQAKVGTTTDGHFGPGTEAKVRAFQRERGVVADGVVGPATWALLRTT